MIPLRDNIPSRSFPFVNYALIAACTVVFVLQLMEERRDVSMIERYGMIPARVMEPGKAIEIQTTSRTGVRQKHTLSESAVHPWFTIVTCIFLHGGWMHFLGNMWFLYIFGDNVEDRFGHILYLLFYVLAGVVASVTHLVADLNSPIPTIGASGAIAGVMGAYLVFYPKAKVLTVLPVFFFIQMIVLPAFVYLGIWFVLQSFQGVMSIGATESTGVAWWAHVGGFVAGLGLAFLLRRHRPAVDRVLPHTERSSTYRLGKGHSPWD